MSSSNIHLLLTILTIGMSFLKGCLLFKIPVVRMWSADKVLSFAFINNRFSDNCHGFVFAMTYYLEKGRQVKSKVLGGSSFDNFFSIVSPTSSSSTICFWKQLNFKIVNSVVNYTEMRAFSVFFCIWTEIYLHYVYNYRLWKKNVLVGIFYSTDTLLILKVHNVRRSYYIQDWCTAKLGRVFVGEVKWQNQF